MGRDIARFTAYVTALTTEGGSSTTRVSARRRGAGEHEAPISFDVRNDAAPALRGKLVITVNSRPDESGGAAVTGITYNGVALTDDDQGSD